MGRCVVPVLRATHSGRCPDPGVVGWLGCPLPLGLGALPIGLRKGLEQLEAGPCDSQVCCLGRQAKERKPCLAGSHGGVGGLECLAYTQGYTILTKGEIAVARADVEGPREIMLNPLRQMLCGPSLHGIFTKSQRHREGE